MLPSTFISYIPLWRQKVYTAMCSIPHLHSSTLESGLTEVINCPCRYHGVRVPISGIHRAFPSESVCFNLMASLPSSTDDVAGLPHFLLHSTEPCIMTMSNTPQHAAWPKCVIFLIAICILSLNFSAVFSRIHLLVFLVAHGTLRTL